MRTETDLPRTIAPSEVRVGDERVPREITFAEIRVGDEVSCTNHGVTRSGVVGYKDTRLAATAERYCIGDDRDQWTLLSRPTPRGSVFDAEPGTLWTDPRTPGSVAAAFDDRRLDDSRMFVWLVGRDPGTWLSDKDRAHLIPFSPPPSELDTLRQNVIDAAKNYSRTAGQSSWDLLAAVCALRDAEAS